MINLTEARELYSELHSVPEDKVSYYISMITKRIREAIVNGEYYVVFTFKYDDTEKTIDKVCEDLFNLGYAYESNEEFFPIRLTIYGWVQ